MSTTVIAPRLFFRPNMEYSYGVRQAIQAMFMDGPNKRTDSILMPNIHGTHACESVGPWDSSFPADPGD